ncbi:hypothetical protein TrVE_jg10602 [Triparma verrucosa]|uniref:EF-hand domain-containing protein n=1 Tax=Triparma verrucosa TaxID=1606542 RepID=A0A9W7CD97_9STRA|nr:hypothetical protein TrVE_jg10602 [Triparma verrucosa]
MEGYKKMSSIERSIEKNETARRKEVIEKRKLIQSTKPTVNVEEKDLYEFWWDDGGFNADQSRINNLRSLESLDDNVLSKSKTGVLVVEGEEDIEASPDFVVKRGGDEDRDDNNAIWLTSSELVLKHAKEQQDARIESMAELPEKADEILKMNTLNWLKARGRGAKMATEMDRVKMLRDWFEALDADGSGDISVEELEEPLISIGVVASKEDLIAMINKYDSSGDGEIDFQEFVKMVMTKEEGSPNAMLKLFEEFSEGLLGDKMLPFSTLVHMYSRKMLFNAVMSQDDQLKQEGQKVLKARIKRSEEQAYEEELAAKASEEEKNKRRASARVALGTSSAHLEKNVSEALGKSSRFSKEEIRTRRDSMRRNSISRRQSVTFTEGNELNLGE